MEPKKKLCFQCQTLQYIWKNHLGKKYCKECASKLEKPKVFAPRVPIKKVSDKRAKQDAAYAVLKKAYMAKNPNCQLTLSKCTHIATDIHHCHYGADRSKYYLDDRTWLSTCRNCHTEMHDTMSSEEAREKGFKL